MSQLNVNAIRHTGASSDAITLASDGTATAKITNNLSNRNLIINGDMRIAQRGTSSTSTGYQTIDRMYPYWTGTDEAFTVTQHALTSSDSGPWEKGFRYSLHVQNGNQTSGAGAGDVASIFQYSVEAQDLATSGWLCTDPNSKLTFSFWIKSSVAQTFWGYVYNNDGGGDSFSYSTGACSANTWKKVTVTIPGHADLAVNHDNGAGITIYLQTFMGGDRTTSGHTLNAWQSYSSSDRTPDTTSDWWTTDEATLEVTGLQLEVGDTATDFEHRSYTDELARCQRYHYVHVDGDVQSVGIGTYSGTSTVYCHVPFPVTMRATPTMTVNSDGTNYWYVWYTNDTSNQEKGDNFAINGAHARGAIIKDPSASGTSGHGCYGRTSDASAKISFSAEL